MKDMNIEPNFSALSRESRVDRHTLKKYYDNDGVPRKKTHAYGSKWDPYLDEIVEIMSKPCVSKKAAYRYLESKYGDSIPGRYSGFTSYTRRMNIAAGKSGENPHPLFETDPGQQLQFDWKEDLTIHLAGGEEIKFNVFTATLSYSREHVFVYSPGKTTDDLIRCVIEVFRRLGGVSDEALTDNMSAIVSITGGEKKVLPRVSQLFRDLGCKLSLCRTRRPMTKGKDENANKFISWIYPYDGVLKNEDELISTIESTICSQCNQQINEGTKIPPCTLFQTEKEYLNKLPGKVLLESYVPDHKRTKVPGTMLVAFRGKRYSVPPAYVGKYVDIYPIGDRIYIYSSRSLITIHTISQNSINYNSDHYTEGLSRAISSGEVDIEEAAARNLERLEKLGGTDGEKKE